MLHININDKLNLNSDTFLTALILKSPRHQMDSFNKAPIYVQSSFYPQTAHSHR